MANIHSSIHGISDVVIWVGSANKQHGLRIKVSNVKNKFDPNNCFVIQMPSLDYNPHKVAKWIDNNKLNQIFNWVKTYQKELYDYENGELDDTFEFLNKVNVNRKGE
jgi:hypothetical protein